MSPEVNLDLEDVPFAILEVVKARILANRRRLGLSQEQAKPRPSTRPRAQFRKAGASSRGWRKPQHGAGVLGDDLRFGITSYSWGSNAFATGTFNPTSQWTGEVWCGDYSRSLKTDPVTFSQDPGGRPATPVFVLPVDNDTGIVVTFFYGKQFFPGAPGFNEVRDRAAFVVNRNRIRRISVPSIVNSCINTWETGSPPAVLPADIFGTLIEASEGMTEYSLWLNYTPTIFNRLNILNTFTSQIKPFPTGKNLVTRDPRQGIYANSKTNVTKADARFCFAEWLGTVEDWEANPFNDSLLVRQPEEDIDAPSYYKAIEDSGNFAELGYYWDINSRPGPGDIFFWDWDDPDYCRAMCLALGFSEADLTP
jgi:hypothetical protein